ncbi:hypothetical protein AcV7_004162 [Taiwanofungus camphoratus]|nr:hypothetical protein AcV7_004162 [Antrodia cinnamomea]
MAYRWAKAQASSTRHTPSLTSTTVISHRIAPQMSYIPRYRVLRGISGLTGRMHHSQVGMAVTPPGHVCVGAGSQYSRQARRSYALTSCQVIAVCGGQPYFTITCEQSTLAPQDAGRALKAFQLPLFTETDRHFNIHDGCDTSLILSKGP